MLTYTNLLRLIGLGLLSFLLWKADVSRMASVLGSALGIGLVLAFLLNFPHILLKTFRWRWMLQAQGIHYQWHSAYLAYYSSIFVGLFTPGRLGELIKALHVSQDCGISLRQAFSSVLADRLFDLYALALVGGLALVALGSLETPVLLSALLAMALVLAAPPLLLMNGRSFRLLQSAGLRLGKPGRVLFSDQGWVTELRSGLAQLTPPWMVLALGMTVLAYAVFYTQAYLLALALALDASWLQVSFAVALGSLVTLLPISISGIGTREAAIVAYLGSAGVALEAALGFSLLVFITFYIGGSFIGSVAWALKPVQWPGGRRPSVAALKDMAASESKAAL